MISLSPEVWLASILVLFVYSMMLKPNPLSKFAEHTAIGLATGFVIVMAIKALQSMAIAPLMKGEYIWGIVIVFGLLMYGRFSKKYVWISRWPVALIVGVGTAVAISTMVMAQILVQIQGLVVPLITRDLSSSFDNWVALVGTITTLMYFMFTMKRFQENSAIRGTKRIGRYFMMIGLGASFGATFMTYIVMLLDRLVYLMSTWLGIS